MIYNLSGVCGTGKTEQLISNIEQIKTPETNTILWASLTNNYLKRRLTDTRKSTLTTMQG